MNRGEVPRRLDQQPCEAPNKSSREAGNGKIGTEGKLQVMEAQHQDLGVAPMEREEGQQPAGGGAQGGGGGGSGGCRKGRGGSGGLGFWPPSP